MITTDVDRSHMSVEDPPAPQFAQLVARHQSSVLAVAYSAIGSAPLAEEIAQETFLTAWGKLRAGVRVETMGAWLCGIARKLAANARRKRRERTDGTIDEHASADPTPLDRMLEREAEELVRRALAGLAPRYREPLVLFYFSGQSIKEVALGLGLSEEVVRQRLSRGRQQLKDGVSGVVERTLAGARPGATFTAAVVAALAAQRVAHAASGQGGAAGAGGGWLASPAFVALAALAAALSVVAGGSWWLLSRSAASAPVAAPVAAAAAAPVRPQVVLEVTRAGPAAATSGQPRTLAPVVAPPPRLRTRLERTLDLDFLQVDVHDVLELLSGFTEVPIVVKGELAALLNLHLVNAPALDVLDEVLAQAGATRTEVPALRLVPARSGATDVSSLPAGAEVSLDFTGAPLGEVVKRLGAPLGLPIVAAAEVAETPVTVHLANVPARAALAEVLRQAGAGFEPTTGFEVTAEDELAPAR